MAMPNDFAFRGASPDDAGLLARAAAGFFTDTFGAANRPEDMAAYLATAFSEERQRTELADSANRVLLALDADGELAGYAHLRFGAHPSTCPLPNGDGARPAEIVRLYAGRQWHGRGLGAQLMDACLAISRECGADIIWLGVWEHNARAIAFYRKRGFQVIGEQSFLLGADRQRDLVMAAQLTSEG